MKYFLYEQSEWIPINHSPRYSGTYLVRGDETLQMYAEFKNGQWTLPTTLAISHWCGQDTRLKDTHRRRLKKIMKQYQLNRDDLQGRMQAASAAIRLARYYAGPHGDYPKGNRITACKFFRLAERLGAPLESSDYEYLQSRWEKISSTQRQEIARKVSKFVGGLGALEKKS